MACGLKESGGLDLALLHSDHDCTAAGVFTKNQVVAAPVILDRQTLAANKNRIRGLVANSGMANACTGEPGMAAALEMQRAAAALFDEWPEQFFVLSTGVIGVQIPLEKVIPGLALVAQDMSAGKGLDLARAIMTTDTRPKHLAVKVFLKGGEITIGGMAKGSGMIHPDMATMLGLIDHRRGQSRPERCRSCCKRPSTKASTASAWTAIPAPTTRCCCWPMGPVGATWRMKHRWLCSPRG